MRRTAGELVCKFDIDVSDTLYKLKDEVLLRAWKELYIIGGYFIFNE